MIAERWAVAAERALAAGGRRRGGARAAIVRLLDRQACALSTAEIGEALREEDREVSRASIYRVLEELEEAGMLQRVEAERGTVRYEAIRHGAGHHHHFVCNRCGRLERFADAELERAIDRSSERLPVRVLQHEIVFRGACAACAA
jgi:Fur family ferric uptake transcriptional regulator